MKIRPIILCGGAGTRLWPQSKNNTAKQFIDFGGWSLLEKTLDRVKGPIFDYPIISTNLKYLKKVKSYLKKFKVKKYKIIVEPAKKNTAPAILSSTLIKDIPNEQCLMFFPADHLVEKLSLFNKAINKNKHHLTDQNIFIFGIKPISPFFFDDKKRSVCILSATSILKILLPERQTNKKVYNSFENMLTDLKSENWIRLYINWELSLIKELGYETNLKTNYNNDTKKALTFNRNLLMENFIIPNKLKLPLFRNILEKYYN